MTSKLLQAIITVQLWYERECYCREVMKDGCKGCPYDKGKICDSATTEFVLRNLAVASREYFDSIKANK